MRAEEPGQRTGMGVGVGTNSAAGLRAKRQKLVYLGTIELKPFQIFQQKRVVDQVCLEHGTPDRLLAKDSERAQTRFHAFRSKASQWVRSQFLD